MLLCTQLLYSLPLIISNKLWYQLLEFIPSYSNSVLYSCISISIHTHHATKIITSDLHWHQYLHLCDLYWLLDSSNLYK